MLDRHTNLRHWQNASVEIDRCTNSDIVFSHPFDGAPLLNVAPSAVRKTYPHHKKR